MMKTITTILLCLFTFGATAQTVLVKTNEVGMIQADHTLYGLAGSIRLNIIALDGGARKDMSDINSGSGNFQVEVWDYTDVEKGFPKYLVQTTANTTVEESDVSRGEVRFNITGLSARTYEVRAIAIPASGINDAYSIHWGYFVLTNTPSSSSIILLGSFFETESTTNLVLKDLNDYATVDPFWHFISNNVIEVKR